MLIKILIILLYLISTFLVILGLSGLWVISIINLLYYLATKNLPLWLIILSFSLAIISELLDYLYSIWGAKRAKASGLSIILSIIFSIILGLFVNGFIPIIGAIIGTFLGTFIGCFMGEYLLYKKDIKQSLKASKGAFIGKLLSLFTKLFFAMIIIVISIIKLFF